MGLPGQVVHLLLRPQPDDLARVQLAEAVDEAVVVFDVAVPVLELIEGRLVDLQDHFLWNRLLLQAGKTRASEGLCCVLLEVICCLTPRQGGLL